MGSLVRALLPHLPDIINCLVALSSSPVHHVPSENGNHPSPSQSVRRSTWKIRAYAACFTSRQHRKWTNCRTRQEVVWYLLRSLGACLFATFQELTRKYFNYCTCFMSYELSLHPQFNERFLHQKWTYDRYNYNVFGYSTPYYSSKCWYRPWNILLKTLTNCNMIA